MAGPALAQQDPAPPHYDPALLDQCLAAAPDRESCIGMAAARCQEAPEGETTIGMRFCFDAEFQQWDARLNSAYATLMTADKASDDELATLGSSAAPIAPALKEMQRAWIGFRDAACSYEASRWQGGSGGGPAVLSCMMTLTARQALWLEDYVDDGY